ncbi:MAG: carbohydrate binding family 9 domain-containing protein [Gemmatimonadetes bacterium]|nr:carbohydrate binding family 9 domain-containing protein [Gemmatimonadota bacterium]
MPRTLLASFGILVAIATLATEPAAAQTAIPLDESPRPTAAAARATGPVDVDGVLDDATWSVAPVIDEFWQQKPDAGMAATERTEVRILFDDDYLYIGAELMDQPGYEPIVPTLQRDPNTRDGDAFGLMLDPFLDGSSVFAFFFNPGGAVRDMQTADDGRINNSAWDAAIDMQTRVHDRGWTLELAIPWSQLRFDPAQEEQVWGLNLLRRIRRKNEDSTWAPMDRRWQIYVSSRGGRLTGLDGLRPGRNLLIKPFALASEPSGELQAGVDTEFDAGLDLKYGITPGLTLDLTANTDFSQVEVDQEQVNLTRFSLFFPEKREFFLENAGVFQFGDQGNRQTRSGATDRDFTLFHSRRIGLTPTGSPLPILGGGRVTGTAGPVSLGALNMQTRSEGSFGAENFTVARVRGEPAPGLSVGGIFVNRTETGGGSAENRSYGVDANLQAMNGYLLIQSYLAATEGTAPDGSTVDRGLAGRLSAGWRDPFWEVFALYRHFESDFDPGVGFVRRRGMRHAYGTFGVQPRFNRFGLLELNPYIEAHVYTDFDGGLQTRLNTAGLGLDFQDGGMASLEVTDRFERVDESFSVRGVEVAAGRYDFVEASASYTLSGARAISGRVNVSGGEYFGGDRQSIGGSLLGRLGSQILLDLSLDHNEIDLPGQASTTADVYGAKLDVFFSTTLLTSAFIQFNEAQEELVTNLRFRWIHAPLSDLYLVLTERRDTAAGMVLDRFLTAKVTRLFSF